MTPNLKPNFFIIAAVAILLVVGSLGSSEVQGATEARSGRAAAKKTSTLKVGQKTFVIPRVAPVKVSPVAAIPTPITPAPKKWQTWALPILKAGPTLPSPMISKILPAPKLGASPRFNVPAPWNGKSDKRLNLEWNLPALLPANVSPLPMETLSDNEYRWIQSTILLASPPTSPLALGLAAPLSEKGPLRPRALVVMAKAYGLRKIRQATLSRYKNLFEAATAPSPSKETVIEALTFLLPSDGALAERWAPLIEKQQIPRHQSGAFPLAMARFSLEKKDLQRAWNYLEGLNEKTDVWAEGIFLRAMINYRSNQIDEGIKELENLMASSQGSRELRSLAAATLAQIYFQKGLYKKSFETYRQVDSSHPLWLESLVQSAWSQILSKDFEGAAGNMFSLHTTYFKGAYQPESYIARTVSYLQLCQFGDAQAVLTDFLRKYKFAQTQILNYKKANPDHLKTIRDFLKAGSPKQWSGLPRSLLIEMARDPEFITLQKRLNEFEDNGDGLKSLQTELVALDDDHQKQIIFYKKRLQTLEKHMAESDNPLNKASLLQEKNKIESHIYRSQLIRALVVDGKKGLDSEVRSLMGQWTQQKEEIKRAQSTVLKASFSHLEEDLSHWLDQSELLFYEIHSGAGEHLRYQMATPGAPTKEQIKKVMAETGKNQTWAFDGEIWEDEVGHYRSSLKNVCPETEQVPESNSSEQ